MFGLELGRRESKVICPARYPHPVFQQRPSQTPPITKADWVSSVDECLPQ